MSLVSVVIPSYNHAKYIRQAVESVLNQTYEEIELIVVDDGSSDASLEYLRTINDTRYRLIEQSNAGAHNAINKGLSLARGDYLAILNSDDVFHLERIERCVAHLKGEVQLVASWLEIINNKGKVCGIKKGWGNMLPWEINVTLSQRQVRDEFALNLLLSNFVSTTSNIVFTRALYVGIGGMRNMRFAHDWDYLLRAALLHKCVLIEEPLVRYRVHDTNTISTHRSWMLFEICWIYAEYIRRFAGTLFIPDGDTTDVVRDIEYLGKSVNTQGNDKVLWMISQYCLSLEKAGDKDPAMRLLDDVSLRARFMECIQI